MAGRSSFRWLCCVCLGVVRASAALDAPPSTDVDVVVVGAGYAGLAAAHQLLNAQLRVAVLEAADHVGGRTRNFDLASGEFDTASDAVVEVGGTFVAPGHTALIALAQETGHELYNVSGSAAGGQGGQAWRWRRPRLGAPPGEWPWWYWGVDTDSALAASVFLSASGRHLFTKPADVEAAFAAETWAELEAAGHALAQEAAAIECDRDTPVDDPDSSAWFAADAITFEGWLRAHLAQPEARSVLRNMCRGMIAQEPAQVSFLSTLKSLKGCWSAGAEDQYRIRGGTQAVPLTLAERVAAAPGGSVSLSAPVRAVEVAGSGRRTVLTVRLANGTSLTARFAVLTGPPALVGAISISPPAALGHLQAQLLQRMPMGTSMKYFVAYDTPWWREAKLSGAVMASSWARQGRRAAAAVIGPGAELQQLQGGGSPSWGDHFDQCMEHSPFDGTTGSGGGTRHYALMCWVEGESNQHFYSALGSAAEQRAHVLGFLEAAFNDTRASRLAKHVVAHNWADQPYARGAYTGFFSPGVQSQPELWQTFAALQSAPGGGWAPHVWVAGSEYQVGFGNGYIEGAIRGGYAAATAVAAAHASSRGD